MTMLQNAPADAEKVVALPADLDISMLHRFRDALDVALIDRPQRLVVDFGACRYLDAQAIRVLLDVHQALWQRDGRLVLRGCNADTRRLLTLAGVLNVFLVEPDLAVSS